MDKKDRLFFKELFSRFARKLDESLGTIHVKLNIIMTRQDDFDTSLAKLAPAIDQVKSDFEAYKAAAQAQGVDLQSEEDKLTASLGALSDLHNEVSGNAPTSDAAIDPATSPAGDIIDSPAKSTQAPAPNAPATGS